MIIKKVNETQGRNTAKLAGLSAVALATAMLWSGAASAQNVPADDTNSPPSDVVQSIDLAPQDKDIVVTGTLLRGVAPTGTN
ncbi:MAG: hypothetical protein JF564_05485, partial [Sphingomonas sp.]|nr:hypothetical protein [Sphingomonas sp.]